MSPYDTAQQLRNLAQLIRDVPSPTAGWLCATASMVPAPPDNLTEADTAAMRDAFQAIRSAASLHHVDWHPPWTWQDALGLHKAI